MSSDRNVIKKKVNAYAQTLLNGCASNEQIFEITGQLEEITKLVTEATDLRRAITIDPLLTAEDRAHIIGELFSYIQAPLLAILRIIAERKELDLLYRINEEFGDLAEKALGAVIVDVITAIDLDDALRQTIKTKLISDFDQDVLLREKVDESIIGGIIMSAHGKRIDASILSQLHQARRVLSIIPTGGEK